MRFDLGAPTIPKQKAIREFKKAYELLYILSKVIYGTL